MTRPLGLAGRLAATFVHSKLTPLVKPHSIDDVPIMALTLWSPRYDDYQLRQVAGQLHDALKEIVDVSTVEIIGGRRRQVTVEIDPPRLASYGLDPAAVARAVQAANVVPPASEIVSGNRSWLLQAGGWLTDVGQVEQVVVGSRDGAVLFLSDVAVVREADAEPDCYVTFRGRDGRAYPAVTLAASKRKGTNAIDLSRRIDARIEALRGAVVPADVNITVTRNDGETAATKSNELLWHMFLAVMSVSVLIWLTLGRREAAVVLIAIPVTLALTLSVFYFYGYTLNRITLFALIFSIGILVDDAIVVVENVVRHARLATGEPKGLAALVPLGLVTVKMLPFDNKSDFQVIINLPEGTPLEQTARVAAALAETSARNPAVVNVQTYVGAASPYNFNGLVRHYFMRRLPHQADLQVNLVPREERSEQSHAIAKRLRTTLAPVAAAYGARLQVAEVPPGPPVLQTLVAEVYGPDAERRLGLAREVRHIFETTPGVVDVDWYVEQSRQKDVLEVDQQESAAAGLSAAAVASVVRMAGAGEVAGPLHDEQAREDVPIVIRLPRGMRGSTDALADIRLMGTSPVAIGEVTRIASTQEPSSIYHKNLRPVTYVTGDMAGSAESPVYAILAMNRTLAKIRLPEG